MVNFAFLLVICDTPAIQKILVSHVSLILHTVHPTIFLMLYQSSAASNYLVMFATVLWCML